MLEDTYSSIWIDGIDFETRCRNRPIPIRRSADILRLDRRYALPSIDLVDSNGPNGRLDGSGGGKELTEDLMGVIAPAPQQWATVQQIQQNPLLAVAVVIPVALLYSLFSQ